HVELLNLTVDITPTGARVVDRGKVHQYVAVCVRGVVAMLATVGEGAGIVAATGLAPQATRVALNATDTDEAAGYRREQLLAEGESFRAEALYDCGGPLEDAAVGYGTRRSWRDRF